MEEKEKEREERGRKPIHIFSLSSTPALAIPTSVSFWKASTASGTLRFFDHRIARPGPWLLAEAPPTLQGIASFPFLFFSSEAFPPFNSTSDKPPNFSRRCQPDMPYL